jgi:hypothetical protein
MERQDSTLPQYRCGVCGNSVSGHAMNIFSNHSWTPAKEWKDWWKNKKTGLIPMGGINAKE